MYSTLESNLVSPYSAFLPVAFSSGSECIVYTIHLSKQCQIPLSHVDTLLTTMACLHAAFFFSLLRGNVSGSEADSSSSNNNSGCWNVCLSDEEL